MTDTSPSLTGARGLQCTRHQWQRVAGEDETCRRCLRVRDPERSKRGRNNRKRGGAVELDIARRYGGSKVGPLGRPHDIEGRDWLTQVKSHTGLPPAWLTMAPSIRVRLGSRWAMIWTSASSWHLAAIPAHWDGILAAMDPSAGQRRPRLIERWASRGVDAREWVVLRATSPDTWSLLAYEVFPGPLWLDLFVRDE